MAKNHSLETNLNFSQLSLEESCPCSHSESNEILSNCKKECVNEHLKNGYQQNQIQQQCEQLLRNQDHETVTQLCNDNKETNCDTDVISYELQTNLHVSEKNSTNFPIFVDNQFQLSENKLEFEDLDSNVVYKGYESENHMPSIMKLITSGLSEPYSIYTYRYFLHNWPHLSFLAWQETLCIGAIVCKLDVHKKAVRRGYIAMLAVDNAFRRLGIGTKLVELAIDAMQKDDCDEIVLETEITNKAALHLYENLGFVRDKRLFRYYLNGVDALRLKLWCK